jgi:hypothetical protein
MRVAGAVGGVVACAGAGVAVASSPKPAGAPLNPPVARATASPSPSASAAASSAACAVNQTDLAATVAQLRAATTPAERRAILQGLSADQRQQVTAMLRGGVALVAPGCGGGAVAVAPAPTIQPQVVSATPGATPITNSYVS